MIRTIIIMAARARTCHAVPWATRYAFTCHNRLLARDFMWSCVHVRWFYFLVFIFLQQHFSSRRTIKWRIIQLMQSGALDFALIHASCISACLCTWLGRWMLPCICQRCISLIAKEMIYETRMNEILRMYNSKLRLQLYWLFFTCRF